MKRNILISSLALLGLVFAVQAQNKKPAGAPKSVHPIHVDVKPAAKHRSFFRWLAIGWWLKHEDFVDNVKAFAYFPISVARDIDDFQNGEISMKFKMMSGQLDKCAGILFNVKPNGDYLTVRFNGKEDNLVLWTFKQGKRSFVKRGTENVPLQLGQWYDMKIAVHGAQLEGF